MVKKEPKVLLPSILILLPGLLVGLLVLKGISDIENFIYDSSIGNIGFLILPYILFGTPIILSSIGIYLFLSCVYPYIVFQFNSTKHISLKAAFKAGLSRLLPLVWTYFLEFLVGISVAVLILAISVILSIFIWQWFFLIGVIILIISVFIILIYFFETTAIVVIENKSGMKAIKRSFQIGKRHFWLLLLLLFVVNFVYFGVSMLSYIPYVGFIVSNLIFMFTNTWIMSLPAIFYIWYGKSRK